MHALPDLFGDEGHQRMQRAQQRFEHRHQRAARAALLRLGGGLALQHRLGELQVPVAELVPGEFVQRRGREVEAVLGERAVDLRERGGEARDDPAIGDGEFRVADQIALARSPSTVISTKRARVPQLVAEVAVAADAAEVEVDVARRAGQRGEREAQRVGAEGGDAVGKLLARVLLDARRRDAAA